MMSPNLNYDEIKSCYDATDDIKASTSFEFGIQNDLYYKLFYSYTMKPVEKSSTILPFTRLLVYYSNKKTIIRYVQIKLRKQHTIVIRGLEVDRSL